MSLESSLADQLLENEKTTEGVVFVIMASSQFFS
jgi:hypothetical protein